MVFLIHFFTYNNLSKNALIKTPILWQNRTLATVRFWNFYFVFRVVVLYYIFIGVFLMVKLRFFAKNRTLVKKMSKIFLYFFSDFSNFQLFLFYLHFFNILFVTNNALNKKIYFSSFFFSHSKKDIIEFLFFGHLFLSIFQKSRGLLRFF